MDPAQIHLVLIGDRCILPEDDDIACRQLGKVRRELDPRSLRCQQLGKGWLREDAIAVLQTAHGFLIRIHAENLESE
jgi:hypothetical protein